MVTIEQDPKARFEKAIFHLLRSFNFIELNVGLLIASIPGQVSRQEILNKLSRKPFDKKMEWFKILLKEEPLYRHIGEKGVSEFGDWFVQAHEARKIRNRYVHAIWRFNPMKKGAPVSISSPEWMKNVLEGGLEESMSLVELESKAEMIETIFQDFWKLRKKYHV